MVKFDFTIFLARKKLKQRELAEILGCSLGLIGNYASGRTVPSFENCIALIKAGMTFEELFGSEVVEIEKANKAEGASTDLINSMLSRIEKLEKAVFKN